MYIGTPFLEYKFPEELHAQSPTLCAQYKFFEWMSWLWLDITQPAGEGIHAVNVPFETADPMISGNPHTNQFPPETLIICILTVGLEFRENKLFNYYVKYSTVKSV